VQNSGIFSLLNYSANTQDKHIGTSSEVDDGGIQHAKGY